MKITISIGTCCLLFAASLFASSLQEQNKAIARRAFEEILSGGRFELAEQLYAKDFVNHGIHRNATLEEDQTALKGWHQAFSDIAIVPEKLIAEGDLVTIYWIARGTNTGAGNGLPATGKKAELAGITIWRIVDGRIKEEWSAFDQLSMMQQLGLLPANK
ncbi:MAG: ester cyclase [Candidatus Udaeobacter sp.]